MSNATVAQFRTASRFISQRTTAWILAVPLIATLIVIGLYPGLYMIATAFSKSTLGKPFQDFVGFSNYRFALASDFGNALVRTVVFAVPTSLLQMALGVLIALLLVRMTRFGSLWRGLIFLPMMTPPVMIGIAWKLMLLPTGGLLNGILMKVGLLEVPRSFLGEMPWASFSLAIADTWQWTPFVALLAYASIKALPDDIRQAAYMDGARPVRTFFEIQLPILMPAFLGIFLIKLIISFKIFDLIYVLTTGGPGTGTTLASYAVFRTLLQEYDVGLAAAQVILLVIVVSLLTAPVMSLHKRLSEVTEA